MMIFQISTIYSCADRTVQLLLLLRFLRIFVLNKKTFPCIYASIDLIQRQPLTIESGTKKMCFIIYKNVVYLRIFLGISTTKRIGNRNIRSHADRITSPGGRLLFVFEVGPLGHFNSNDLQSEHGIARFPEIQRSVRQATGERSSYGCWDGAWRSGELRLSFNCRVSNGADAR